MRAFEGFKAEQGTGAPALPDLKQLVVEASQALARLDRARLEELALSCQALNRALSDEPGFNPAVRTELARQAREAARDMAVFARVLAATGGNLQVMNRLRELRAGRLEYSEPQARGWLPRESLHGDN